MTRNYHQNELIMTLRILKRDPLSIVGTFIAIFFVGTAAAVTIFGNSIVPYNPIVINPAISFLPPSLNHLMGTDNLGRDVFSRVVIAVPIDAEIAFAIVGASLLIGTLLGSLAGYFGGRVDDLLMRITDLFLAFPSIVLAVAVAVALGPGVDHVIEAMIVAWWPVYARLARAGALSLKDKPFVEAARVAGVSGFAIIRKHIVSNSISSLLVYATLDVGNAILYASVLSYLGLGAQPPQAEWGRMVYDAQDYLLHGWWMSVLPGVALFVVAIGFNLLGDALRDTLDPRYRR